MILRAIAVAQILLAVCSTCAIAARPAAPGVDYEVFHNVEYVRRGETPLLADVYVPKKQKVCPGVLVVHGGAWVAGNKSRIAGVAERLAENGYTAVSINYRLAPSCQFPAQIEDCKSAVRWMRREATRYKIDPERLGAYGYSAGGHLVCMLGTTDAAAGLEGPDAADDGPSTRVQCVVAGGAPCDFRALPPNSPRLRYWLGGTRSEKPDAYELASPLKFISKDDPPILFFHGQKDTLVPLSSPQAMVERMTAEGLESRLYILPEADHIRAFLDPKAVAEGIRFLDQHLKRQPKNKKT